MLPHLGFAFALLATGIQRLLESAVSWRRARARPGAVVAEAWLFPLMVVLHTALVFLPLAEVWFFDIRFRWAFAFPALAVLVLATGLRAWTLLTIGAAWNVRVVKPNPDQIATTGPYRYIRHPNYLAVILELAALPLLGGAWRSALVLSLLNAFVLYHRIQLEELTLSGVAAWRDAMRDKKRLIPGIF